MSKLSAANGPGFTMAIDREIGEGGAVGVVKQRCGRAGDGKGRGHLLCFAVGTRLADSGPSLSLACAGILPELACDFDRINAGGLPPGSLIAGAMSRAMMDTAERN